MGNWIVQCLWIAGILAMRRHSFDLKKSPRGIVYTPPFFRYVWDLEAQLGRPAIPVGMGLG